MNNKKDQEQEEEQTKEQGKIWILVAVDNSEYAVAVAEEAAKVALEKKANVVFLSVVPIPYLAVSEGEVDAEYLSEEEKEFRNLHNALIDSDFNSNSGILVESKRAKTAILLLSFLSLSVRLILSLYGVPAMLIAQKS